jgi:hypothetical protein
VQDTDTVALQADSLEFACRRVYDVDHPLVEHSLLQDQVECQASVASALASFDANARSVPALLIDLAHRFER